MAGSSRPAESQRMAAAGRVLTLSSFLSPARSRQAPSLSPSCGCRLRLAIRRRVRGASPADGGSGGPRGYQRRACCPPSSAGGSQVFFLTYFSNFVCITQASLYCTNRNLGSFHMVMDNHSTDLLAHLCFYCSD